MLFVWKFCLIYPNLATHSHGANTQFAKTYTNAVESKQPLFRIYFFDFDQVFAHWVIFFGFTGK